MNYDIPPCFYRVSIKALILDETGKFLLIKEKNGEWDIPGGGLDEGEDIQNGLRRELQEECGLQITSLEDRPCYFLKYKRKNGKEKVNAIYQTTVKNLNFTPSDECIEIRFVDIEEAKGLPIFPNVGEFVKHYNPNKHGNF